MYYLDKNQVWKNKINKEVVTTTRVLKTKVDFVNEKGEVKSTDIPGFMALHSYQHPVVEKTADDKIKLELSKNQLKSIVNAVEISNSDVKGYITAVVDINGTEYKVELHTIRLPTDERNKRIRWMAEEQARRA